MALNKRIVDGKNAFSLSNLLEDIKPLSELNGLMEPIIFPTGSMDNYLSLDLKQPPGFAELQRRCRDGFRFLQCRDWFRDLAKFKIGLFATILND